MPDKWEGLIVFLGASDLEKTHRFYNRLLGLPLYKNQGLCRIYDVPGGGRLGFCTHLPVVGSDKAPILTLLTGDVDGAWQSLQLADLNPGAPKETPRFKIYHFFVSDPDGYLVEIQRFLD